MAGVAGLVERLAALRRRLGGMPPPSASPAPTTEQQLAALEHRLGQIRGTAREFDTNNERLGLGAAVEETGPSTLPMPVARLSWRIRRLLLHGREAIDRLRALAPQFLRDPGMEPVPGPDVWYAQTQALVAMTIRSLASAPEALAEQDRLADGAETALAEVHRRLSQLERLAHQQQAREEWLVQTTQLLHRVNNRQPDFLTVARSLAARLLANFCRSAPLVWWEAPARRTDWLAAAHTLNTVEVFLRVGHLDALWSARREDAVVALLIHDAGMAALPTELLAKTEELSAEDRQLLESHVHLASESLRRVAPGEGWLLDAVHAHHERLDGTGYPRGLRGAAIPRLARWLAICDTYAALGRPHPRRPARTPRAALAETLEEAEQGRLDTELAEYLLALTFYPPGTVVELADGAIGRVIGLGPREAALPITHRPVVELLLGGDGQPLPWPEHVDLAQVPGRHVVRGLTQDEARQVLGPAHLWLW